MHTHSYTHTHIHIHLHIYTHAYLIYKNLVSRCMFGMNSETTEPILLQF